MTESRKNELLEAIKYKPDMEVRANPIAIFVRSIPLIYSLYLKIKMFISRNIYTKEGRNKFTKNKELFILKEEELKHVKDLKKNGITIIEDYLSNSLLDEIKEKSNIMFKELDIDKNSGYNLAHKRLNSLEGMSYEELALTEVHLSLKNALINVPQLINIVFEESLLKILSNYLGYIPTCSPAILRSSPKNPPVESSFFHKDSHSLEVLNIFIYLNDVDEDGGPFCYIPKSHNNSIQSCKPRTSSDMNKVDSYGRISNEEMKKYYPEESWFPIIGKKGTIVIVDTVGFHKGPMWNNKPIEKQYDRDIILITCTSRDSFKSIESKDISKEKIKSFTPLQKLFLDDCRII